DESLVELLESSAGRAGIGDALASATARIIAADVGGRAEQLGLGVQLQRLVRRTNAMLDPATLSARLLRVTKQVCRIEVESPGGTLQPLGTGFLVGPDLVLTNDHVVSDVHHGSINAADLRVRFDHWIGPAGEHNPGIVYLLDSNW